MKRTTSLRQILATTAFVAVLAIGGAAKAADPEMLSNACAGCHGTDGTSAGPATPTIANLSIEYFVEMMKGYKAGTRPSTVMARIAKGYSDEEIQAMAGYFQQRPFGRPEQMVDAAKVKTGKSLAKKYCESCHEDEGKVGEGVGVLAGQKLPYMQYSITDFLGGKRQMEKRQAKKFEELKADHGEAGFEAVLNYYAGVK